ncbi:DUF6361 family protein [Microbacterium elymi]|uniref:DUF6361 family protein n=1 Tax=Microbacterium elymi TaxID=2909587 RepID=A0ABY5NN31_9MICO|nr:DUF6361 family protein [Microbacterium elymi]UUT36597.1 DUF6361 family protein [Microbacterium elymi]
MLEIIDLFREPGTVDELGIGAVRDALSDILFPGTSVLHTRLRYVLFIPWLLRRAADDGGTPDEMRARFRAHEYRRCGRRRSAGRGIRHHPVLGVHAAHRRRHRTVCADAAAQSRVSASWSGSSAPSARTGW